MSSDNNINKKYHEISRIETPQSSEPPQSPGSKESITIPEENSEPKSSNSENQASKTTIDKLFSDIMNSKQLSEIIMGNCINPALIEDFSINTTINQTADTLKNINDIKDELCKIPLDICEMEYINTNIVPLLNILNQLSTSAYNLATSSNLLSISPIVHPKKHELKETIHLVYKINDKCEDVYDVLKKRINFVLKK